jgi:hypothetical protein
VASVSSKTPRLIRHQDGPQRWGLIKIPTTKIRAFAISNKGLAIASPKRSSSDQQKIDGFQKLNGFSAKDAQINAPLQKRLTKCRQGAENNPDIRIKRCFIPPIC